MEGTSAGSGSGEEEMRCVVMIVGAGLAKMAVPILEAPLALAKKREVVRSSWSAASLCCEISL